MGGYYIQGTVKQRFCNIINFNKLFKIKNCKPYLSGIRKWMKFEKLFAIFRSIDSSNRTSVILLYTVCIYTILYTYHISIYIIQYNTTIFWFCFEQGPRYNLQFRVYVVVKNRPSIKKFKFQKFYFFVSICSKKLELKLVEENGKG